MVGRPLQKGVFKLNNLFKPIATNAFISFEESGQLVLPRKDALFEDVGCFP